MTRLCTALPLTAAALLALAACGEGSAPAASGEAAGGGARTWTVDHAASTLTVSGEYGANPFTGTFEDWTADIAFSPDDLEGSSIRVEVQVGSYNSGDNDRDAASASDRWLNAEAFPTAVFESSDIEATADGYVAHGTFTIVGATNPMDLPFNVAIDGDMAHATGGVTFDHHAYGITGGYDDGDTGDYFTVNFDITATAAE